MSAETTLKSILGTLVDGGCHNGVNSNNAIALPYIVFHEISGIPLYTITEYAGTTDCRFQIDVFARTPEQAKGLALGTIKTAIDAVASFNARLIFQMKGQYSNLDKSHQYITEYSIET